MKRFIEGSSRSQVALLPPSIEDYFTEENPVRVVDVFVDELDLGALGFAGTNPSDTRARRTVGLRGHGRCGIVGRLDRRWA